MEPNEQPQWVWAERMKPSPFVKTRFTADRQAKVISRIAKRRSKRKGFLISASLLTVGASLLIALLALPHDEKARIDSPPPGSRIIEKTQYYDHGKLLLSAFPDPELQAGKTAGYMFSFTAPFEAFQGKRLALRAVHVRSGQSVQAIPPTVVTEPSPGYPSLGRFTARFALPLGGIWRYEFELDGQAYANVELTVQEPSWEVSPEFRSGTYLMRGVANKVGFIDPGFLAGKTNKYMWHFWGPPEELNGKFVVKAVKQGDDQMIDVFSADALAGENNGADRHFPSSMSLPEPGLWRLLPFVNGRLIESIVVDVK
ncbi:DUF4871 domain-containing protein [Paenibacillus sp. HJGM_3]|uniref:DUF4871 domain-containing protein n=1 Tax=Paenibacillus sp. HJGM_3 TaxID=3379816 RepID=UPI00385EE543